MEQRYNEEDQFKLKKTIIAFCVVLLLILCICLIILNFVNTQSEEKKQAELSGNFNSIKDILEYYGCEFIKLEDSSLEDFSVDIYTKFKYELYDGEESNEEFYNNVIEKIADFLNYSSFRLLDESKEEKIEIQVICNGKNIQTIYINGIEDYYIYMDSQLDIAKYKKLKMTEISIQSEQLINCIQNNWDKSTEFGTRESIFENYYIYFDEGIKIRIIDSKIYNIVFTDKYAGPVVNNFTVETDNNNIIKEMGTPTFKNEDESVIGYKSNDIYVFFEENQISIYPNLQEDYDEFFELVDQFLDNEYTFLEFMNELTYLWPDYEKYEYTQDTVFLSYPSKGIDVKINYNNVDGIVLYNNIGVSQEKIDQYLEHTEFIANLQIDNIYNAEERRIDNENNLTTKCDEYQEEYESEDDRNRGEIYKYYMEMDTNGNIKAIYFVSQSNEFVNCQLIEAVNSYVWMNEYCFVYSKKGKGIYYYDLRNQSKGTIITGEDNFDIDSYKDGILSYDKKTMSIQYN